MPLDGAVDPSVNPVDSTISQAIGFDSSLDSMLRSCDTLRTCAFGRHGGAANALHALIDRVERTPMRVSLAHETRVMAPTMLRIGIAAMLYGGKDSWPLLAAALEAAYRGDGSQILQSFDEYTDRMPGGKYGNGQSAFFVISCVDGQLIDSVSAIESVDVKLRKQAPWLGPDNAWLSLACSMLPVHATFAAGAVQAPSQLPRVLVVSTTHDPATPYAVGVNLARSLKAALLSVQGEAHTAYHDSNPCVVDIVDAYLLSGKAPRSQRCP